MVEWRHHPVYDLWVSADGEVRADFVLNRSLPAEIRVTRFDREGYSRLNFWHQGKLVTRKVAILVAETFHGPRPFPKAEVCHGVGGKWCDRADNLRWGTRAENLADRRRDGTLKPYKRLSLEEIATIKQELSLGATKMAVARRFGTSPSNVRDILRRP